MGGFVPEEFDRIVIASLDFGESAGRVLVELTDRGIPAEKIVSLVAPVRLAVSPVPESIGVA
jgi:hypothetical protein